MTQEKSAKKCNDAPDYSKESSEPPVPVIPMAIHAAGTTVTVGMSDTDIVVIMLPYGTSESIGENMDGSWDLGINNAHRYIDVSALFANVGRIVTRLSMR